MRHYQDQTISCPFFPEHKMPSLKLQWHLPKSKCEQKFREKYPNTPILRCKFNYFHIFFSPEDHARHETTCSFSAICSAEALSQQVQRQTDKENIADGGQPESKYGTWGQDPVEMKKHILKEEAKKSTLTSAVEKARHGKRCVGGLLTSFYSKMRGACKKSHKKTDEDSQEEHNPWISTGTSRKREEKAMRKSLAEVTNRSTPKPREIL